MEKNDDIKELIFVIFKTKTNNFVLKQKNRVETKKFVLKPKLSS